MYTVAIAIVVAAACTAVGILAFSKFAVHLRLVDEPQGRKQHKQATPIIGGLAMVLGFSSLYLTMPQLFLEHWVVFAGALVLMATGVADDIRHIHSAIRMFIQIAVACAIHFEGNLSFKSVGDIWFIGDLGLGPYSLTFTCIAVVGGVNAINMMDGLDGLCGGLVLVTLVFLSVMAYFAGMEDVFLLATILGTCVLTFLLFNFRFSWNPNARVFMGDSGAYVLGFMIAALFLMATQGPYSGGPQALTPITALWLLFIPLIDIAGVIWRRSRRSRWPVDDDREHIHYLLVDRNWSVQRAVNTLIGAAIVLSALGAALFYSGVSESWSFVVFMFMCVAYFRVTNWLAYKEGPFRF